MPHPLLLLDLDGTLLDHRTSVRRSLASWTAALAPPSLPEDLADAWLAAEQRHFPAWRDGSVSFAEQRRRRLRDVLPLLGLPMGDDDELDRVFARYLAAYERSWTTFEDVDHAVDVLAARAAGLRAVHVDRTSSGVDADTPDPPVRDLRGLADAVLRRTAHRPS